MWVHVYDLTHYGIPLPSEVRRGSNLIQDPGSTTYKLGGFLAKFFMLSASIPIYGWEKKKKNQPSDFREEVCMSLKYLFPPTPIQELA